MNIYRHTFFAECPSDKAKIAYSLQIKTGDVIMAERIERECSLDGPAFHEDIADKLYSSFGGRQTLSATHGKVAIVTTRGTK